MGHSKLAVKMKRLHIYGYNCSNALSLQIQFSHKIMKKTNKSCVNPVVLELVTTILKHKIVLSKPRKHRWLLSDYRTQNSDV